jgi:hypothetical protein
VIGQIGYWTAGRLQNDAVVTHPFKRLHNHSIQTRECPARHRQDPASAGPDRLGIGRVTQRSCCGTAPDRMGGLRTTRDRGECRILPKHRPRTTGTRPAASSALASMTPAAPRHRLNNPLGMFPARPTANV